MALSEAREGGGATFSSKRPTRRRVPLRVSRVRCFSWKKADTRGLTRDGRNRDAEARKLLLGSEPQTTSGPVFGRRATKAHLLFERSSSAQRQVICHNTDPSSISSSRAAKRHLPAAARRRHLPGKHSAVLLQPS
ncbi:hypothetical protein V5799_028972 [Amblyomma americanum]|uniref:Uncharacterized protein n=1 Tax=Amblyomma americanum TaxID=6943 RepID=A0AAQ4ESJ4_AMBAM